MRLSDIFTKFKDKVLKPFGSIISNPAVWAWIVPILMIIPNIGLTITESNSFLAKITNLILPFGIYLLLCTLSRRIGRAILWMIPLMVFAAFQIVLLFLYGESIIAIDMFLNVMTTNFTEATELLANLKSAIATVLIIYIPPIAAGSAKVIVSSPPLPSGVHAVSESPSHSAAISGISRSCASSRSLRLIILKLRTNDFGG